MIKPQAGMGLRKRNGNKVLLQIKERLINTGIGSRLVIMKTDSCEMEQQQP